MRDGAWHHLAAGAALAAALLACTLPWTAGGRNTAATMVVETVFSLQTLIVGTDTPAPKTMPPADTVAPPLPPISTPLPLVTQPPPTPVVQVTSLCWTGPGTAYPVVSGIKAGTTVTVLGVGSQAGWLIIENPIYRDRCWIESRNLALDPFFNTSGLKVFIPPPTPGPSITPGPSPTP